jgi:hypothetical protein
VVCIQENGLLRFCTQALYKNSQFVCAKEIALTFGCPNDYRNLDLGRSCQNSLQQNQIRNVKVTEGCALLCKRLKTLRNVSIRQFLLCDETKRETPRARTVRSAACERKVARHVPIARHPNAMLLTATESVTFRRARKESISAEYWQSRFCSCQQSSRTRYPNQSAS